MSGRSAAHQQLVDEIARFIQTVPLGDAADAMARDAERDRLLARLVELQARLVPELGRLARAQQARFDGGPEGWPAMPTDVFRFARLACFDEHETLATFRTSGTTSGARGAHHFADLSLYERAAMRTARHALFGDVTRERPQRLVVLAYDPRDVPDSSLAHMLGLFASRLVEAGEATEATYVIDAATQLDADTLVSTLERAIADDAPVALLGTSFAFVFAEDELVRRGAASFALPPGSRVMLTGGFKGRTRTIDGAELRRLVATRFGVPEARIVSEYGMTELSSQLYGRGLLDGAAAWPEPLYAPPWMRVSIVDPDTLRPLPVGETGLVRIDDLANVDSIASIQTSDRGYLANGALHLVGRDPGAVPRGCSLAIEESLSRH